MMDNVAEAMPELPDFSEEWKRLQILRHHKDSAEFWDERSKRFGRKDAPTPYVEEFLEKAALKPGESVFDMGCGSGALAIPLAEAGHDVVAADFSSGMLGILEREMDARDLTGIRPVHMSWEDDWEAHGVLPKSCDVCVASRSIAVADLGEALRKLSSVARRRVCITLSAEESPRVDGRILKIAGLSDVSGRDFGYAFNILLQQGYLPEVSYIGSERKDAFDSFEEARDTYVGMLRLAVPDLSGDAYVHAQASVVAWLEEHLVANPTAGAPDGHGEIEKALTLDRPRTTNWAFIAWDVI